MHKIKLKRKHKSKTTTPTINNFNGTYMTMEGDTSAQRAGTYYITVYLKDEYKNNYIFANGRDFVVLEWTKNRYDLGSGDVVIGAN